MSDLITSISYNQQEIIHNILQLHTIKHKIDADITYSKGVFYKDGIIPAPEYKFDISPQTSDTIQADARALPISDNFFDCVMFDPPFLATTGKSLHTNNDSNIIAKRFSVFNNEKELYQFYIDVMKEVYRVLKDDGILIFKCQDKTSSGKQYLSHVFIINEAVKIGYYPKDLFILLAKSRIIADWQVRNQKTHVNSTAILLYYRKAIK